MQVVERATQVRGRRGAEWGVEFFGVSAGTLGESTTTRMVHLDKSFGTNKINGQAVVEVCRPSLRRTHRPISNRPDARTQIAQTESELNSLTAQNSHGLLQRLNNKNLEFLAK